MNLAVVSFDLVNPFQVSSVALVEALVVVIEAILLYLFLARKIGKAFAASFCANLVTGLLSIFYFIFTPKEGGSTYSSLTLSVVLPLVINVLLESLVLRLFYRNVNLGKILKVSTIANIVSYVPLLIFTYPSMLV
jgi:hypothetical protein